MPIEIKELIIRAAVDKAGGASRDANDRRSVDDAEKEAIVEACVKQVLRILKKSKDR